MPDLPLPYLVRLPASATPPPLLVLLHGYGSNEQDLFGLTPYLDERLLVISARAPHELMPGSYAWFDLDITPRGISIDPEQAEASRLLVGEFVSAAADLYQVDAKRIVVGGFSQGGIMAALLGLTQPRSLAGIVVMSGMIRSELLPQLAPLEELAGKPWLMQHGLYDQVLPVSLGRAGRDFLATTPIDLTYREYPIAHEISAESLRDLTTWLQERL